MKSASPEPGRTGRGEQRPTQLEKLRQFMARHLFVASRIELLALGIPATTLRSWLKSDRLVKLLRGVYAYGRDVETREAVWRAALLVAGPGSALMGRSALEAWGAVQNRRRIPLLVEVATARDRRGVHRGCSPNLKHTVIRVVRRAFEAGDVKHKDGLALTRAPLALIEFAASASAREVRFAFLELCRLRLFGRSDVDDCFRRLVGKRGARKLRPLLAMWVPELNRTRSVFEGLFLLAWIERGFPLPEVNRKVFGREVDFFWEKMGIVLELDGAAFHSGQIARGLDLEKTRFLENQGLKVIRISWKQFMADPVGVIDQIARELGILSAIPAEA